MPAPTLLELRDALEHSTLQLGLYAKEWNAATRDLVESNKRLLARAKPKPVKRP